MIYKTFKIQSLNCQKKSFVTVNHTLIKLKSAAAPRKPQIGSSASVTKPAIAAAPTEDPYSFENHNEQNVDKLQETKKSRFQLFGLLAGGGLLLGIVSVFGLFKLIKASEGDDEVEKK